MAWIDSHNDDNRQAGTRMPGAVRLAVVLVSAALVVSALALFAVRGPALLLDLAAMGAAFLCL